MTGRCGLLFWVSLYKTSKSNTSEPAFTTIINKSQKKKKWMFSRSKEELASIEDGQNSRVEKEVLLRSGWYDCVLSLVVLCLWDAKSKIVSLCTVCRKGHQKIQKRLKVSSSCSQPEYRNSLKRWALNFLYIYIHIHFHIPIYIFIFLPNLVSSWKRTLQKGLSANFLRLMLLIWLSPILVFMHRCCLQRLVVWLHSSKKQSLF